WSMCAIQMGALPRPRSPAAMRARARARSCGWKHSTWCLERRNNMRNGISLSLLLATSMAAPARAEGWSYAGHHGPTHWSELDSAYETCKLGGHQSPIDIRTRKVARAELPEIQFSYRSKAQIATF